MTEGLFIGMNWLRRELRLRRMNCAMHMNCAEGA